MMELKARKTLYKKAVAAYEAGTPIMTDPEFDALEKSIRDEDPSWKGLELVTARKRKHKFKLPVFMPSLNKVYPPQVQQWMSKRGDLSASDKLDGNSLAADYDRGNPTRVYTRGNGKYGQDVTHLLPYLTLPKVIADKAPRTIRFEAIMKNKVFDKYYAKDFDNARNMAAGMLNRTSENADGKALGRLDFVALGVYGMTPQKGLAWAKRQGFTVNHLERLKSKEPEALSKLLAARIAASPYMLDGLVLTEDNVLDPPHPRKPDDAAAYKENLEDEAPAVEVLRVKDRVSGAGRITPVVYVTPTQLSGVEVTKATLHNVAWALERKIGPGAIVRLIRSGEVIPKIVAVDSPSPKPYVPSVPYELRGRYAYARGVSDDQRLRNVERFLTTLGVENIKLSTISRIVEADPKALSIRRWFKIAADPSAWTTPAGFKAKSAANFAADLAPLRKPIEIAALLTSSNYFAAAFNVRRFEQFQELGLRLLPLMAAPYPQAAVEALDIKGLKTKLKTALKDGLPKAIALLGYTKKYTKVIETVQAPRETKGLPFAGATAVWTGYRNKVEEKTFTELGGTVAKSFSGKTTYLIYSESGKRSTKVDKAGDRAYTWDRLLSLVKA